MNLFFYRLKGSTLSQTLAGIIGVLGFLAGFFSINQFPIVAVSIWVTTILWVALMLLVFCHFKNQEKIVRNTDEMITLLKRINYNTKSTHEE